VGPPLSLSREIAQELATLAALMVGTTLATGARRTLSSSSSPLRNSSGAGPPSAATCVPMCVFRNPQHQRAALADRTICERPQRTSADSSIRDGAATSPVVA
jgi:hypothetical protein